MLDRLRGAGYKTRLLHPHDTFWDLRLGVQTVGLRVDAESPPDAAWRTFYTPTPYRLILRAFERAGLGPQDSVVDLGSGLGRAVFLASWMGARRAVGVEVAAPLHAQAVRNRARGRQGDGDVDFVCIDARDYRHHDTSLLYMAHPFPDEAIMAAVMEGIERDLARNPRPLRIVYANPIHAAAIDASACFRRYDMLRAGSRFASRRDWDVGFWRTA